MKLIQPWLALHLRMTFFFLLGMVSCNNQSSNETTGATETATTPTPSADELVFDKFLGTWQNVDGKNFERWTKKPDGTYRSVAFNIKGSDTSWNEQANIYPENENWIFENTVKGQNDGKSVRFKSSYLDESSVQFSNPAHDFPTDLNYTVSGANTVRAFIIGPNEKGGKDTIPFNYIRAK